MVTLDRPTIPPWPGPQHLQRIHAEGWRAYLSARVAAWSDNTPTPDSESVAPEDLSADLRATWLTGWRESAICHAALDTARAAGVSGEAALIEACTQALNAARGTEAQG